MYKTFLGLLFAALIAGIAFRFSADRIFENPYTKVCDLVSEKIYLPNDDIRGWLDLCYSRTKLVGPWTPKGPIIADIKAWFALVSLSHLDIYNAAEVSRIWQGTNEETGMIGEFVDGEFVLFNVFDHSPASDAGLRRGDIIVSIQGEQPAPQVARLIGGTYRVRRQKKEFDVEIVPRVVSFDERIRWRSLDSKTLWLQVPSFQKRFFEKAAWNETISKLRSAQKIVVDLRGNNGGNFVAGLRFLSPFLCGEQEIGFLDKPKSRLAREGKFDDDMDDEKQLAVLDESSVVRLGTFDDYGCLGTKRVVVLVDAGTASTAEMVAQALKDYMGARILGVRTPGQLLVGVWYPMPELGAGVKISIPEALYQTRRGLRLEGAGVQVDRELFYSLEDFDEGLDSWVRSAWQD